MIPLINQRLQTLGVEIGVSGVDVTFVFSGGANLMSQTSPKAP
jgi:hypothetical protein